MPHLYLLCSLMLWAAVGHAQTAATLIWPETTDGSAQEPAAAPAVYHAAEEMPAFPGGTEAFQKFLRAKLQYPDEALRNHVSGKVYVSFIVDENGHLLEPRVVKGLGSGLDAEALRLVRIMPWWTPGRNSGQPVRVAYTLPIIFRALE